MKNYNPNLDDFLKIYSQSLLSTGLTRGLDEKTYIPTRLDTALKQDVLKGKKKLVVLTGNAGDGKTVYRSEQLFKIFCNDGLAAGVCRASECKRSRRLQST